MVSWFLTILSKRILALPKLPYIDEYLEVYLQDHNTEEEKKKIFKVINSLLSLGVEPEKIINCYAKMSCLIKEDNLKILSALINPEGIDERQSIFQTLTGPNTEFDKEEREFYNPDSILKDMIDVDNDVDPEYSSYVSCQNGYGCFESSDISVNNLKNSLKEKVNNEFINDEKIGISSNKDPEVPQEDSVGQKSEHDILRDQFINEHKRLFDEQKKKLGGWFRHSIYLENKCGDILRRFKLLGNSIKDYHNISLESILSHATEANNRSRQVCMNLGWLDKKGNLTKKAPQEIVDNHPSSRSRGSTLNV